MNYNVPDIHFIQNQEHRHIDDLIKNGIEEGLQVRFIDFKVLLSL